MPEPILAKDVIIQFLSGGDYFTYGCATDLETTFTMTTKSVKTIGDGVWKRSRGQSLGQTISLNGVVKRDSSVPDAFDLLDYFKNMTEVDFKIVFYDEAGIAKILTGIGLPVEVKFSAGSEGHSVGSITIEINGDPDNPASNPNPTPGNPDDCIAEIAAAHTEVLGAPFERRYVFIDSMVSGSATISRWDYTIDGGGIQTKFTDGNIPTSWILSASYTGGIGTHTMVITPVCDNGFSGTPFTLIFP